MNNNELTFKQIKLIEKIKRLSDEDLSQFIDFYLKEIGQSD